MTLENNSEKQSRKGKTNNPHGRPAGVPNKATTEAREAIARFVDSSAPRLLEWLGQVADGMPEHDIKPNPAKAFELVQSIIEYHVPKLARTELTGKDGEPMQVAAVDWRIVEPKP